MEKIKAFIRSLTPRRMIVYIIGLFILACGITMNTKTHLGVSPVLSVAYNITQLTGIDFSLMTFIYYLFLIALQFFMDRAHFEQVQWLQLAVSFLTSAFIGLFDRVLPEAQGPVWQIVMLLLAVVLTAIGIILTIGARFVPNPADGLAAAIGRRMGKSLGLGKNVLDLASIALALLLGLVFTGGILGVGLGTVITMLLTGRVVALLQKPLLRLSGLDKE